MLPGRCNVLGHQALQCVGTETSAAGTGRDRIVELPALLRQPSLEDGRNVGAQRRASHLAAFPEATNMSADAEFDIAPAKGCDFAVAEAGLNGDEQQSLVPPSDPCTGIRSSHERCSLFVGQKFDRPTHETLRRESEDTLALQGQRRFMNGHELEEGV
jgi:hypothetical protein